MVALLLLLAVMLVVLFLLLDVAGAVGAAAVATAAAGAVSSLVSVMVGGRVRSVGMALLVLVLSRRLLRPKNKNARRSPLSLFPNKLDALVLRSAPPSARRQERRDDDAGLLDAGGDDDPRRAGTRQDEDKSISLGPMWWREGKEERTSLSPWSCFCPREHAPLPQPPGHSHRTGGKGGVWARAGGGVACRMC